VSETSHHHHDPTQRRALRALGLPAVIGVALLVGANLEHRNAPTASPPDAAICPTGRVPSRTLPNPPPDYKRGLHRVNSPVPEEPDRARFRPSEAYSRARAG
jgi:hypothetical protein